MPTSYIQGQVQESQGSHWVRQGWFIATKRGREKVKKKKRKEKDQGRQEGGSSKGKVPCALHQEFLFFVHEYLGLEAKRPISVEVWAPTRLGLRGSHVWRKFRKLTTLRSESSTLKGLLYAPIQQKQYHKRTTLRRLKIPLRSIVARKVRTIALEQSAKKAVIWQATINLYSRVGYPWWFLLGLYCVAWLMQESVSSRIFVRKKGMSHVQVNGRSQQTLSAEGRKGKSRR